MMPKLVIQGNDTNVIDLNPTAGNPIIMVHGLLTNTAVFYFTVVGKLIKNHRVVLYDLRGHGSSAPCDKKFTLDDLQDDLFALSEALGIKSCHLVGYSLGGALVLYAAVRNPQRFESLTLIEAPLFTEGVSRLRNLAKDERILRNGIKAYTASTKIVVSSERRQKLMEQYQNLVEVGGLLEVIGFCEKQLRDLPFEQLNIPVLLLYARLSGLGKTGSLLAKRLPQARLYKKWADHNLPVTHSKWVSTHLVDFLG